MARTKLGMSQTFYLSPSGNDANDGLTPATAWKGLNNSLGRLVDGYDFDGYGGIVTLQLADGTYNEGIHYAGHLVGVNNSQNVLIRGNTAAPWQCVIQPSGTGEPAVALYTATQMQIEGVRLSTLGAGSHGIYLRRYAKLQLSNIDFYSCTASHVFVDNANCLFYGGYMISGGAASHLMTVQGGLILNDGGAAHTVEVHADVSFSQPFAWARGPSTISFGGMSFDMQTHTVSGKRYQADYNGFIDGTGGNPNFFPGTSAGSTSNGGQYA